MRTPLRMVRAVLAVCVIIVGSISAQDARMIAMVQERAARAKSSNERIEYELAHSRTYGILDDAEGDKDSDLARVKRLLRPLAGGEDPAVVQWFLQESTKRILRDPRTWMGVCALAAKIAKLGHVSGDEAYTILRAHGVPRARRAPSG